MQTQTGALPMVVSYASGCHLVLLPRLQALLLAQQMNLSNQHSTCQMARIYQQLLCQLLCKRMARLLVRSMPQNARRHSTARIAATVMQHLHVYCRKRSHVTGEALPVIVCKPPKRLLCSMGTCKAMQTLQTAVVSVTVQCQAYQTGCKV